MLHLGFEDYWQKCRRYESMVDWSPVENTLKVSGLSDIVQHYDLFLLDSDGLLLLDGNIIPTAVEAINLIRKHNKSLRVVSNGGAASVEVRYQKYLKHGLDIHKNELISAYEAICYYIHSSSIQNWGLLSDEWVPLFNNFPVKHATCNFDKFDGFLIYDCKKTWQGIADDVIESLQNTPRSVVVANPDIGVLARDSEQKLYIKPTPGLIASFMEDNGIHVEFLGKPFSPIYDLVQKEFPSIEPHKTLMLGDTLQTDILGGLSRGYHTFLAESGMYKVDNISKRIEESGILPHYIAPAI